MAEYADKWFALIKPESGHVFSVRLYGVWQKYDACELVKSYNGPPVEILIDQVR